MQKILSSLLFIAIGVLASYLLLSKTEIGLRAVDSEFRAKLDFADGSQYIGDVDAEGLLSGSGRLTWGNGVEYRGEFEHGLFNGTGTLTAPHSHTYEGSFVDGYEHGQGKLSLEDGTTYTGEFIKGDLAGC